MPTTLPDLKNISVVQPIQDLSKVMSMTSVTTNTPLMTELQNIQNELQAYQKDVDQYYSTIPNAISSVENVSNTAIKTVNENKEIVDDYNDMIEGQKEETINKIRMVEINNYYSKKYNAQSEIMKIIIFISVLILILWYIDSSQLTPFPSAIFTTLISVILAVGIIVISFKVYYLLMRNNIDFDQMDFYFKNTNMPKIEIDATGLGATGAYTSDSGYSGNNCYNDECCPIGFAFNSGLGRCALFGMV